VNLGLSFGFAFDLRKAVEKNSDWFCVVKATFGHLQASNFIAQLGIDVEILMARVC
jgi:hypothetical protein